MNSFNDFNLPAALMETLERMQYATPTPIQAQAIPAALQGRDVLGSAQTGTGKTGAFAIPMIAALINDPAKSALVMTPTRELANQVLSVARDMIGRGKNGKDNFIKTALLIGGESMGKQHMQLRERPRLIVGTPGRINDHLRQNSKLLSNFSFLVLDEADRMLDMGFSVQIDEVLAKMNKDRQTLMFSATFPPSIVRFSQSYLKNPERVSVGEQSRAHENINHQMMEVSNENKYTQLLAELESRQGTVIVFVKTKHGADKLADKLKKQEYEAGVLHGGLRQGQRDRAIAGFRKQVTRILVATDVAARGLDVPHVEHVINYDMPQVAEDYIHRIGRTARAGAKGEALALVTPNDRHLWRDVARLLDPNAAPPEEAGTRSAGKGGKKTYGKKQFGKKPFGERKYNDRPANTDGGRFERKPYIAKAEGNDGERDYSAKKFGAHRRMSEKEQPAEKKPFKFNKYKGKPAGDKADAAPRSEFKPRDGFKKKEGNFQKREGGDFAKREDSFKPRDGFKKREGDFKKEGGFKKTEGGFAKKDGGFKKKPGGFKKPDGAFRKKEGGFKPRTRAA